MNVIPVLAVDAFERDTSVGTAAGLKNNFRNVGFDAKNDCCDNVWKSDLEYFTVQHGRDLFPQDVYPRRDCLMSDGKIDNEHPEDDAILRC